jgi:hypothetical protein
MKSFTMPSMPSVASPSLNPPVTCAARAGTFGTLVKNAPPRRTVWVMRNKMKIGVSTITDSRTPRMFSAVKKMISPISTTNFTAAHSKWTVPNVDK